MLTPLTALVIVTAVNVGRVVIAVPIVVPIIIAIPRRRRLRKCDR